MKKSKRAARKDDAGAAAAEALLKMLVSAIRSAKKLTQAIRECATYIHPAEFQKASPLKRRARPRKRCDPDPPLGFPFRLNP